MSSCDVAATRSRWKEAMSAVNGRGDDLRLRDPCDPVETSAKEPRNQIELRLGLPSLLHPVPERSS